MTLKPWTSIQRMRLRGIRVMGSTRDLTSDPSEWLWKPPSPLTTSPFFNYSTRAGYRMALATNPQITRLQIKQSSLDLTQEETNSSIQHLGDKNKTAKQQTFLWLVNSGGLPAGGYCVQMDYPAICLMCNREIKETVEHSLQGCKFARRVWRAFEPVWKVFQ